MSVTFHISQLGIHTNQNLSKSLIVSNLKGCDLMRFYYTQKEEDACLETCSEEHKGMATLGG